MQPIIKILIFLVFSLNYSICYASAIIYDVYHNSDKLKIDLRFYGNSDGTTKVYIPDKIWDHKLREQIKNIKVIGGKLSDDASNLVIHDKAARINIMYEIHNIDSYKHFYTRSYQEGFFFLHDFALIYPKIDDETSVIINYHVDKSFNNYFISEQVKTGSRILTILKKLQGGISISGSDSFLQSNKVNNSTIFGLDISGSNFNKIKDIVDQIVSSQKDLCNVSPEYNNFIFIGNKLNNNSYKGTMFKNDTMIFLLPSDFNELELKYIVSHENFHKLIGDRRFIRFDENNSLRDKWFSEGFTDYFALKTNLLKNIITKKEYKQLYDRILKRYNSSPYKNLDYKNLSKKYWQSGVAKRTIYDRGHIIANKIDQEIHRKSNKTLEDVLCKMLHNFIQDENLFFSKEVLHDAINDVVRKKIDINTKECIDGGFVSLPP